MSNISERDTISIEKFEAFRPLRAQTQSRISTWVPRSLVDRGLDTKPPEGDITE